MAPHTGPFEAVIASLPGLPPDPSLALVFPGQGAQSPGMAADVYAHYPAVRALFQAAGEALDFDIAALCFEGPEEELTRTENAQPTILLASLAYLIAALEAGALDRRPAFTAGHSLGQYTALVAAGALSPLDALRLVRERGRLMSEAGPGRMAALLGLPPETAEDVCARSGAEPANYNLPTQTVIGGAPDAVERAMALAREAGGKALPINVSGAFHTSLMAPAAARFAGALAAVEFAPPRIPVVSNVTARPLAGAAAVREDLARQITSPVRWHQSVQYMLESGVGTFVEVGPGNVLTAMLKRAAPEAAAGAINSLESLKSAASV